MGLRCQTNNLADFIANLDGRDVYDKTIYVDRSRRGLNGGPSHEATSFEITMHVTAVVELGDDGQQLVECNFSAGIDRLSEQLMEGSNAAEQMRLKLMDFCQNRGLTLRPGILDF